MALAFAAMPECVEKLVIGMATAGLDEGISSLFLPILVCMENPYKRNKS